MFTIELLATLTMTLAPAPAPQDAPTADETRVAYSSSLWREHANAVRGTYRVLIVPGTDTASEVRTLVLGADFATKAGPDLKVVLSPLAPGEVTKKTALRGGIVLGLLARPQGEQELAIPPDVDLSAYRSVLIHCEKYTKLWAAAPLSRGEVLASGRSWTKKSNKVSGGWEVARDGERRVLRLGGDFKTKSGPDLKVVLSPIGPQEVRAENALRGGVVLGALPSHKGTQEFVLPAGTDLEAIRSLLIHCEKYAKLWAAAPFTT